MTVNQLSKVFGGTTQVKIGFPCKGMADMTNVLWQGSIYQIPDMYIKRKVMLVTPLYRDNLVLITMEPYN